MDQLAPMAEPQGQKNAIVASHLGSNPPEVVASAVDLDELADAPRPKVWVVEAEKRVSMNGQLFTLRAGKEIDENNYNIDALRKQGVKLHPLEQSA